MRTIGPLGASLLIHTQFEPLALPVMCRAAKRNATASLATREAWYSDLALDASDSVSADGLAIDGHSLYVKATGGNSLQAIDLDCPGKVGSQTTTLTGPTGRIVDWSTALHHDSLVAAAGSQGSVTVWQDRVQAVAFDAHASACVSVRFHPTVAGVLATSANSGPTSGEVRLWNVSADTQTPFWRTNVDCGIDSLSLRGDGQLLAASTRAGTCAIYDPRLAGSIDSAVGVTAAFHAAGRPTRVLWTGEAPFLITTGQSKMRERSAALWDQRNLVKPLASLQLQPSTKTLIPLYDEDTRLAYFAEKGDVIIHWADGDPSSASPLAQLGSVVLPAPISGCALLPKPQLGVMRGEIARVHAVVESTGAGQGAAIIPITHIAPRRTYLDFHSDLFPDTRAPLPAQSFESWLDQEPVHIPKMTLDPAKTADSLASLRRTYSLLLGRSVPVESAADHSSREESEDAILNPPAGPENHLSKLASIPGGLESKQQKIPSTTATASANKQAVEYHDPKVQPAVADEQAVEYHGPNVQPVVADQLARTPAKQGSGWKLPETDHARFKYLEGFAYRPTDHFTNLLNVNLRFSQQNDPVRVGPKHIAVSLKGAGGQVGVFCRDSPGRVSDTPATIVHGADVVDIELDPFDPDVVATAGVDGRLQMWRVPDIPLVGEVTFELEEYIHVTADRIHQVRFHPCARGVVAVLVSDIDAYSIYVYSGLMLHFIIGKTSDGIHSFEWSPSGDRIALTTRKSRLLRIYDARSQDLLASGPAMDSIRPSRIAWLGNCRICLAGFSTGSRRQLALYSTDDLSRPLSTVTIDVGPGVLVPISDADCGTIYLDDRGSRLTHAFEVVGDQLIELPKFESPLPSLGMAALPKAYANVTRCEVLRAYRLNSQSLESVGFRVPRKRPEFFQDAIFPDTVDTETPAVDTLAWLGGAAALPLLINLCPPDMKPLSEAPPVPIRKRTFAVETEQTANNTKDAISAMLSRVDEPDEEQAPSPDSGSDWDD
ncbi:hypothetical protein IW148_003358 [Coemansia sp. RSA 1199]|nr:hypothetical protein IW148_003358 [Coemansia sp. RSA 1199]